MLTLFINAFRLVISVFKGAKNDHEFRVLLFLLTTLILGSVLFYTSVEGWNIIDALYFTVMTMATVGYGDVVPTKPESKIFTVVYVFLSVGIFASLITKLVAINVLRYNKEPSAPENSKENNDGNPPN